MTIYGKTLPEIFAMMPWQFKVIITAGVLWIPFALLHALYMYINYGLTGSKVGLIEMSAMPANAGALDPSLTVGPGGTLVMAYTAVTKVTEQDGTKRLAPQIRLANTSPPCKTFNDVGEAVSSIKEEIVGPDSMTPLATASWWIETPSIVYDPGDKGHEYKLFAYKYLWVGPDRDDFARLYGTILYKSAHVPTGGSWSKEQWLFSASRDQPPAPYNDLVQLHLNDLDPSLQNVYFYARPSVVAVNNVLYMTLSAFTKERKTPDRVIMIASADHAKTWHYLSTLLRVSDLPKMGPYSMLGGASLLSRKGKLYLAAVLGDKTSAGLGTFIMKFDDPAKGQLSRSIKSGLPDVVNFIPHFSIASTGSGGGYAAYNETCRGGLFVSEYSGIRKSFQIFNTYKDILE